MNNSACGHESRRILAERGILTHAHTDDINVETRGSPALALRCEFLVTTTLGLTVVSGLFRLSEGWSFGYLDCCSHVLWRRICSSLGQSSHSKPVRNR